VIETGEVVDWVLILNWIIAFGLPLLVGLITTRLDTSLSKVLWLAGLNVLNAGLGELVRALETDQPWSLTNFMFTLLGALAVAYGAYSNVWKPTGAAAAAQEALRTPPASG